MNGFVLTFQESAAKAKKLGYELKAGGPNIQMFWSSYGSAQDDKKLGSGAEGTKENVLLSSLLKSCCWTVVIIARKLMHT